MKTFKTPFKYGDALAIGELVEGGEPDLPSARLCEGNPSITLWNPDGTPVVCYGFYPLWPGLAAVWCLVSTSLKAHPIFWEMVDDGYDWFHNMSTLYGIRRFQTDIRSDFKQGRLFAKLLGFRAECDMIEYGPNGETMTSYVWLKKEHVDGMDRRNRSNRSGRSGTYSSGTRRQKKRD